jgi:hypothetical protein
MRKRFDHRLRTAALCASLGAGQLGGLIGSASAAEPPGATVIVQLRPQNTSGEKGTAAFFREGRRTRVVISVTGDPPADTQPANLHFGTCQDIETIQYVLQNVRHGSSTTLLDVPFDRLTTGRLIVNIQDTPASLYAAKDARSVTCGTIPFMRAER